MSGRGMRMGSLALTAAAVVAIGGATVSWAGGQTSSGQYAHTQLTGRAVLQAATFRAGSAPGGAFFSAVDRTNATNNGIVVAAAPDPAFANQPVQGFSAVIPAAGGDWWP